jgi:anti-sigma B factor antagonist
VTELTVEFTDDGDRSVLTLTGELDIDSVGELREQAQRQLSDGRCQALTLDLSGLTFLDSSGLGLLLEVRRLALSSDVAFAMVNVPGGPARVIAIAGLTETFGLSAPDGGAAGS